MPPSATAWILALVPAPLLAQESETYFDAPLVTVGAEGPAYRRVVDFDGDGDLDAIGTWTTRSSSVLVGVWINDGKGAFGLAWQEELDLSPELGVETKAADGGWTDPFLEVGDFNGDGFGDFVLAAKRGLVTYLSDGATTPVGTLSPFPSHAQWLPTRVALAVTDLDGDGRDERIVLIADPFHVEEILVHWPDESITRFDADAGSEQRFAGIFPIESDGEEGGELMVSIEGVAGSNSPEVIQHFRYEEGRLVGGERFRHGLDQPLVAGGDVDGDGDEDVVLFGTEDYRILRRLGSESWFLEEARAGGPGESLADVDGDGDLDAVCCGSSIGGTSGPPALNDRRSLFRVSLNDGTGLFEPAFEIPGLGARQLAGAVDVDQDGDVDLLAGRCIYYARGPLSGPIYGLATGRIPSPGERAWDVDRDGDRDPFFGLGTTALNLGDGTLVGSYHPVPTPQPGRSYVGPGFSGDFDGDGHPDLLIEERDPGLGARMLLLSNNGGGGLIEAGGATPFGASMVFDRATPEAAFVFDAEGDGDLDLVTRPVDSYAGSALWLNDGKGKFSQVWSDPDGFRAEAFLDVNQDGLIDLLINQTQGSLQRLTARRGIGAPDWFSPIKKAAFDGVTFDPRVPISAGDLNGDGYPDVLSAREEPGGRVSVQRYVNDYLQTGKFRFFRTNLESTLPPVQHHFDLEDPRTAIADVDGDGNADVLMGSVEHAPGTTAIFRRNEDPELGIFFHEPPRVQVADLGLVYDVDGDGDEDLVASMSVPNLTRRLEEAGLRRQFGSGTAGSGAMLPTAGASGSLTPGSDFEVRLTGGLGGSAAIMAVGLGSTYAPDFPLPGLIAYVKNVVILRVVRLQGPAGVPGAGFTSLMGHVFPDLVGATVYFQFLCYDPESPFRVTQSNGLKLVLGE